MKKVDRKQIKVVFGKTPSEFESKYNKYMSELVSNDPESELDLNRKSGYLAFIKYTVANYIPENIADELSEQGLRIFCSDCPYLQQTNDNRRRRFPCNYSTGLVSLNSPACSKFYSDLVRWFYDFKKHPEYYLDKDKEDTILK